MHERRGKYQCIVAEIAHILPGKLFPLPEGEGVLLGLHHVASPCGSTGVPGDESDECSILDWNRYKFWISIDAERTQNAVCR